MTQKIGAYDVFQFCPSCARDTFQRPLMTTTTTMTATTTTTKEFECRGCNALLMRFHITPLTKKKGKANG